MWKFANMIFSRFMNTQIVFLKDYRKKENFVYYRMMEFYHCQQYPHTHTTDKLLIMFNSDGKYAHSFKRLKKAEMKFFCYIMKLSR